MFNLSSKFQRVESNTERRRWWLFKATDFQSLMYPCFNLCRILGILPYRMNVRASSFETSKLDYILSAAIACFFCLSALTTICLNISGFWFNDVRKAIEMNSFYMLGSFMIIVTFVSSGPRIRLLQTILKISSTLPSESYLKQSMLIHAKDIIGFFYLLVEAYFWYSKELPVIVNVMATYIVLLEFQMNMLYVNCVCVLKAYFKKINDDLANLTIMHDELYSVIRMYYQKRNPLLLKKLNALKKRHLIVSGVVRRLKIIFSSQLLATVVATFIEFTIELYFGMIEWNNGLSVVLKTQVYSTYVIFSFAYYVAKIILIALTCETAKNQAVKISTTIHDVLNSTSDEQIKYEIHLFALQIMHCDNTFSAKGLFLDATLITTMVGTIATYLLILIQFLTTTHSCDEKTVINITQAIS